MKPQNFKRAKYACYFAHIATAPVFALPPLLFLTFREMYNISFTLLGSLVLINFLTQLFIDLIFSFLSKYFNLRKTTITIPLLISLGFIIYSIFPQIFPNMAYSGLVLGTILFSVSSGLCEVLLSPIVAAIPSENPERDMSFLHSLYAWGLFASILVTTLYFNIFGAENWMYLGLFYAVLPVIPFILFYTATLPEIKIASPSDNKHKKNRATGLGLCFVCIFLGGAAEQAMTNWISGYMETSLKISKTSGDIFGMAVFAVLLGLGRILYAKCGKNIFKVLVLGMMSSTLCYLVAALSSDAFIALFACALTGFCTSMLWPGTLILMEEKIPSPGIAAYALMAAGGDLGASVAPQMLGIIVDKVSISQWAVSISSSLLLTPEQIGMKTGMLITAIFPLIGIFLLIGINRYFSKNKF